ncbi:hypothetical protein G7046_g455 [Stylonectria norvegica]|nr:hypothetical protein G7046_g455 [Stylonectria norvegica]
MTLLSSSFSHWEVVLPAALVFVAFKILYYVRTSRSNIGLARGSSPSLPSSREKTANSTPGFWEPDAFKTPIPTPYPDWSIENTKPLPYRAFRYGPKYNITMGLRTIQPEQWIELDNQFPRYHAEKKTRIQERGNKCVRTHPEAYPAAMELLQELTDYLPARYPNLFKRTSVGINNIWSGESFNIVETPLREDPMAICARLVQDDLALMIQRPDGEYYLLAGAVLLAGFWRLSDKYEMSLSDIHTSADVPGFREKLETGMTRFFKRIKCDSFYSRNNYFVQVDDALAWSWSIGDEDHPTVSWSTVETDKPIDQHWFRSERQSLRRLPKTGAVCFTIRTYFLPITDMAQEDYVPGRLASAIRSWGDDVSVYKGKEKYGDVLLDYLDQQHETQLERGLVLEKEDEVRKYPW